MPKDRVVTGIDIGSSKICTIISTVDENGAPSVIGVSSVESRGIKKGVVVDIDDAVEVIAESLEGAERMAGYAVSSAFVTVDGTHITSLNSRGVVAVSTPEGEITRTDVDRVIEAARAVSIPANREIVHVIPRDFVVDSQEGVRDPVGMSGVRLEVETNIISGSATAMRNLAKCVQQVGVDVEALVFGGVSASTSAMTETERELGAVLVDLGGQTVDMVTFAEGSPVHSAVLPVGGRNITNDLAIGLRTTLENAETIKLKLSSIIEDADYETADFNIDEFGLEEDAVSKKLLNDIIKARLSEIFSLVALEIKKSGYAGQLPAGAILVGGGSLTYAAEQVAKQVLKMPVRVAKPTGLKGLIDELDSPRFAASAGLIQYGAQFESAGGFSKMVSPGKVMDAVGGVVDWVRSFLP